jgi:hypothetical protein
MQLGFGVKFYEKPHNELSEGAAPGGAETFRWDRWMTGGKKDMRHTQEGIEYRTRSNLLEDFSIWIIDLSMKL